jgi:hypothetical protein
LNAYQSDVAALVAEVERLTRLADSSFGKAEQYLALSEVQDKEVARLRAVERLREFQSRDGMVTPTIHQRVHGYLWNWATGPGWARDGSEIAKLSADGMRVLKVQLQDNGPIPVEQAQEWRGAGMKVWGMVGHVDGREPLELAAWLKAERVRLSLTGLDFNFEEDVRAMDAATNGQWSVEFTREARRLMPTLPMHLDTYYGPAAATPGINLGAYKAIGCRFSIQTFWGPEGLWDDPPTNMVKWCAGASPVIPRAIVKPILRTAPNNSGKLPDYDVAIADWKASGCRGGALYPIESYDFDKLRALIRKLIAAGVAY